MAMALPVSAADGGAGTDERARLTAHWQPLLLLVRLVLLVLLVLLCEKRRRRPQPVRRARCERHRVAQIRPPPAPVQAWAPTPQDQLCRRLRGQR